MARQYKCPVCKGKGILRGLKKNFECPYCDGNGYLLPRKQTKWNGWAVITKGKIYQRREGCCAVYSSLIATTRRLARILAEAYIPENVKYKIKRVEIRET